MRKRRGGNGLEAWPGYVDALSTLLMVTIFVLLVFVLAEAFLSSALMGSDNKVTQLKNEIAQLSTTLALEASKNASLSAQVDDIDTKLSATLTANASLRGQLSDASTKLTSQQTTTHIALDQLALLNQQIAAMRAQLAALNQALDDAKAADKKDNVQIVDLGKQLNEALARKVAELEQYQSEFFKEMKAALVNEPNLKIIGDRFVFESDVLFPVDQATLTPAGEAEIAQVAKAVIDISKKIPPNVKWILSVDGYADSQKITGGPYTSNFDLSAARALTVLHLLVQDGVPEDSIAAWALGSNNPLATGNTAADYAQNRRIEFRLTTP